MPQQAPVSHPRHRELNPLQGSPKTSVNRKGRREPASDQVPGGDGAKPVLRPVVTGSSAVVGAAHRRAQARAPTPSLDRATRALLLAGSMPAQAYQAVGQKTRGMSRPRFTVCGFPVLLADYRCILGADEFFFTNACSHRGRTGRGIERCRKLRINRRFFILGHLRT